MYAHTLIIGGTGMLRDASIELAAHSRRLTSVARTRRSLDGLDRALPARHGLHHPLALDWSGPDAFLAAIVRHLERTEPPDLVVAWIHDVRLGIRFAGMLRGGSVRFFHLIGSATADPATIAARALADARFPRGVAYHQVILGTIQQGGPARWLTHAEISSGTLEAIRAQQARFVVGSSA